MDALTAAHVARGVRRLSRTLTPKARWFLSFGTGLVFFFSSRRRHTRCLVLEFRRVLFRSRWGKMPLNFLVGQDIRHYRYGLIGLEDWSMSPVIQPGAIVLIDQNRRRITQGGWTSQHNRPIYFLEHRDGYRCGWCALAEGRLIVLPHPASQQAPAIFDQIGRAHV